MSNIDKAKIKMKKKKKCNPGVYEQNYKLKINQIITAHPLCRRMVQSF